jgi:hypothetical protein
MAPEDRTNAQAAPYAQTPSQSQARQAPNRVSVRILATGAQTGNTSGFIENAFPPGSGFPMHIHHNEDEATMSLRGNSSSSLVTPG